MSKVFWLLLIMGSATLASAAELRSVVVTPVGYTPLPPGAVQGLRWSGMDLVNYGGPCCGIPCAPWQTVPWYGTWGGHHGHGHGAGRYCRQNVPCGVCRN